MSTSGAGTGGSSLPDPVTLPHGGTGQITALLARGSAGLDTSRVSYVVPAQQPAVANINVSASLFSASTPPASLFPANTLAVGDVVRIVVAGELFNNSGGAANMSFTIKVGGQTWLSTANVSIASAATSTRTVFMQSDFSVIALGAFLTSSMIGPVFTSISAANARTLVLANTDIGNGGTTFDTTANAAFDILVNSNVNNAATTGTLKAASVQLLKVG